MKLSETQQDLSPNPSFSGLPEQILVTGVHLVVTPSLHEAVRKKVARLLRHQIHLVRIRVEFQLVNAKDVRFVAKGRIEIIGPDIIACVTTNDAYKSLDLLVDRLDRKLRERKRAIVDRRNNRTTGSGFRDCFAQAS